MDITILIAIILAAIIIGFTSGITNEPAAGHITSGITGFAAGILVIIYGAGKSSESVDPNEGAAALYFIVYLCSMFLFYIFGNICRVERYFKYIWGKPKEKD